VYGGVKARQSKAKQGKASGKWCEGSRIWMIEKHTMLGIILIHSLHIGDRERHDMCG
jgi:hypothetical protein